MVPITIYQIACWLPGSLWLLSALLTPTPTQYPFPVQGLPFPFPQPLIPIRTCHFTRELSYFSWLLSLSACLLSSHSPPAPPLFMVPFSLNTSRCLSLVSTIKPFLSTTSWRGHVLLFRMSCPLPVCIML